MEVVTIIGGIPNDIYKKDNISSCHIYIGI